MPTDTTGGNLFVVDNSDAGWTGLRPIGCQQAQRAARYSDEAIEAVKRILRTDSDDAAMRLLDDAARAGSADIVAVERAAVAWSERVVPIRDRIMAGLTASPDDAARVRSYVVGSTCDVFQESSSWPGAQVPGWRASAPRALCPASDGVSQGPSNPERTAHEEGGYRLVRQLG